MGYGNVFGVPAKWACAANTNRVVQGSFKDFIDGLIYFVWSGFEINTAFTTVHHCFIPSYGILYEPAEEYHTSQHACPRLKCYCASGANLYKWMQNGISIVWLTLALVPPFVAVFSIGSTLSSKLLSNTDSSGPMSGYPNRQRSERKWKITFLASFVAAANGVGFRSGSAPRCQMGRRCGACVVGRSDRVGTHDSLSSVLVRLQQTASARNPELACGLCVCFAIGTPECHC